ncbi:YgjV family protein [Motiliproteus sp.]|uniref:YgjV family protein n=1 Tax=Motiliproteus sp. TaxID=1898955 RepID=UPI003BAD9B40
MTPFLLSQILAGLVILVDATALQMRKRSHLQLCLCLASSLLAIHFFLLDKQTAGWMMILAAVRFFITIHWQSKWLAALFVVVSLTTTAYTFAGYLSLLSGAGNLLSTLGSFCKTDRALRLMLISASCCWIVHNTLAFTPLGILVEGIFLSSGLIGFYRYHLRRKPASADNP